MITEEKLLQALSAAVDDVYTEHVKLVDSELWEGKTVPEFDLPANKNALWAEPELGIHLVNINNVRHFKKHMSSIKNLFEHAVAAGYLVQSQSFEVPQYNPLFSFKEKAKTHVALVTMFSPKASDDCWYSFVQNMEIPEGVTVDIILGDNSGGELVKNLQLKLSNELSNKYQHIHIADLGEPYTIKPEDHYLEMHKHAHVAVNYSKLFQEPVNHYDYILKIEDDMEPPVDGFVRLYKHMKDLERKKRKVACVAGYYRQKLDPYTPCLSMQPEIWGKTPKIADMQPRLFRVEMQGGGFALYNCQALSEVLPYKLTFKRPNGNYYMAGWDGTIGENWSNNGWEQYCDGTLYCAHHF